MTKKTINLNQPPKWRLVTSVTATILASLVLAQQQVHAATDPASPADPTAANVVSVPPTTGSTTLSGSTAPVTGGLPAETTSPSSTGTTPAPAVAPTNGTSTDTGTGANAKPTITPTTSPSTTNGTGTNTDPTTPTTGSSSTTGTGANTNPTTPTTGSSSTPGTGVNTNPTPATTNTGSNSTPATPINSSSSTTSGFQITPDTANTINSEIDQISSTIGATNKYSATTNPTGNPTTTVPTAAAIDSWMPNKMLQNDVLKALQGLNLPDKKFDSVADITQDDMKLLTTLLGSDTYIDGKTSYSLEGLQYATNLTRLSLNPGLNTPHGYYVGDVTDISPLASLTKLTDLDISQNRITDITPLEKLTDLTELNVQMNQIADLSPLKALTKLTHSVYGSQFIMNDPIYVDAADPTATLKNEVTLPDGTKATLVTKAAIMQPIQVSPDNGSFYYKFYFNGAANGDLSTVTPSGDDLVFGKLRPQMPGFTGDANGQFNANGNLINVVPVKDNFYLVAQGTENGNPIFQIVQPYVLADKAAPITVNYVDRGGKPVADPTSLSGLVGQPYETKPATVAGYNCVETQGNPTGTFSAETQTVTYIYEANVQPITVKYHDEAGKELTADVILTGKLDEPYTAEQKVLPGYTFVKVDGLPTGKFSAEATTVTFIYTATVEPITVKYVDENGTALCEDLTLTGKSGDAYATEQLAFPGYTFVSVAGPTTGTLGATAATVTYTYKKDVPPTTTGNVTVHYETADGQEIAPSETLTGDTGSAYTTIPKEIPGYILVVVPDNATGNFTDGSLTVTYVYQTLLHGPIPDQTPGDGQKPPVPGNGPDDHAGTGNDHGNGSATPSVTPPSSHPASAKQPKPANAAAASQLPQTDEQPARLTGLLGLLAGILSLSWLGFSTKRRKRN